MLVAVACGLAVAVAAQAPPPQEPFFRGGANLVRLDVYASVDGAAVTDLAAADFEVLEDNVPQEVTAFQLVPARGPIPDSARVEPSTVAESRARVARPDARVFVLFLDTLHVQIDGSYRAQNPVADLLDRVVGEDDLVGVMTPEISARNVTFSPRTASVGRLLASNWAWGRRGTVNSADPREDELKACYPDMDGTAGMAKALIERRREQATLDAIGDLLGELERMREERTFVLLLTEGWVLPPPDNTLAAPIRRSGGGRTEPGGPVPIGVGPDGRLNDGQTSGMGAWQSCERERSLLATTDLGMEFQQLTQRANRANVSFYPIDPRGLVAFDDPIGPDRPAPPRVDGLRFAARQAGLRTLAAETDGTVVLNTDIERALPRLLTDVGSYYLLGYYSTNQKLDGRYRRLTVRVKRPGVNVRARPGYLAPTSRDLSRGGGGQTAPGSRPRADSAASGAPAGTSSSEVPPAIAQALSRLPGGRTRPSLFLQAAGGSGYLQITVELDRAVAGGPEYAEGATVRVDVNRAEAGNADAQTEELTLEPGKRVFALRYPARDLLAPGPYQVRAQVRGVGSRVPLSLSMVARVPPADALLGSAAVASRRGPGTGRLYEPTADPQFRRTERLMVETPLLAADATVSARLLNRAGQPMAVPVTLSERLDESLQLRVSLAELALAPLAMGEYVVEITATRGAATDTISYGFRIVS